MNQEDARISRATRFAKIWWKSGPTLENPQEFMALGLGVSKKTIQNWEKRHQFSRSVSRLRMVPDHGDQSIALLSGISSIRAI